MNISRDKMEIMIKATDYADFDDSKTIVSCSDLWRGCGVFVIISLETDAWVTRVAETSSISTPLIDQFYSGRQAQHMGRGRRVRELKTQPRTLKFLRWVQRTWTAKRGVTAQRSEWQVLFSLHTATERHKLWIDLLFPLHFIQVTLSGRVRVCTHHVLFPFQI